MPSYNSLLIITFTPKAKHVLCTANMWCFRSYKFYLGKICVFVLVILLNIT